MSGIGKVVKRVGVIVFALFVFTQASTAAEYQGVGITGFVDASYFDADSSAGTFSLDQVEIDFEKKLADNLSVRADINYLASTSGLTFDDIVEQGFLVYALPGGGGLALTFGKFNAPIGFELLDPVDMYQYSHSLVFDFGLPTNLTGIMGSYAFNGFADISVYVVNGWDNNADNNSGKTVGGRLGITPVKGLNVGLSAISGTVESAGNTTDTRTVFDIDLMVTLIEKLTIGAEFNSGTEEKASAVVAGEDADWTGFLVMGHYDFTESVGLTLRYDWFDDKDGARLGSSMKETRKSYTISPTFVLGEGAGMLVEYRRDESDALVFANSTDDTSDTFAVEFTYSF